MYLLSGSEKQTYIDLLALLSGIVKEVLGEVLPRFKWLGLKGLCEGFREYKGDVLLPQIVYVIVRSL